MNKTTNIKSKTPCSDTNWASKLTLRLLLIRHGETGTQGLSKQQLQVRLAKVTDTQQCEHLKCLLSEKRVAAYMQKIGGQIKKGEKNIPKGDRYI